MKNLLDWHPELYAYPPNEFHLFRYTPHESLIKRKTAYEENPNKIKKHLLKSRYVEVLGDSSKEG
ncbi:MAG: hypothetical protein SXQ77_07765, partial [Halobacteria archaeon]|nr:hypothetical protein [Halobacteria archaeon]